MWSRTVPLVVECSVASEQGRMEWDLRGQLENKYKKSPRWHENSRVAYQGQHKSLWDPFFPSLGHAEFYSFCSESQGLFLLLCFLLGPGWGPLAGESWPSLGLLYILAAAQHRAPHSSRNHETHPLLAPPLQGNQNTWALGRDGSLCEMKSSAQAPGDEPWLIWVDHSNSNPFISSWGWHVGTWQSSEQWCVASGKFPLSPVKRCTWRGFSPSSLFPALRHLMCPRKRLVTITDTS